MIKTRMITPLGETIGEFKEPPGNKGTRLTFKTSWGEASFLVDRFTVHSADAEGCCMTIWAGV